MGRHSSGACWAFTGPLRGGATLRKPDCPGHYFFYEVFMMIVCVCVCFFAEFMRTVRGAANWRLCTCACLNVCMCSLSYDMCLCMLLYACCFQCNVSVSAAETAQCVAIEALGKVAQPGDEGRGLDHTCVIRLVEG